LLRLANQNGFALLLGEYESKKRPLQLQASSRAMIAINQHVPFDNFAVIGQALDVSNDARPRRIHVPDVLRPDAAEVYAAANAFLFHLHRQAAVAHQGVRLVYVEDEVSAKVPVDLAAVGLPPTTLRLWLGGAWYLGRRACD
jgi:hypothetical protein